MTISLEEVRKVASLARIGVPEERLPTLAKELSGILNHIEVLNRAEIATLESQASAEGAPLRADEGPPIAMSKAPSEFAPEMRGGFFLVPRLSTHEDAPEATE